MIICVTGLPGAGKSVTGGILAKRGYKVYELGDIVREMMKKKRIPQDAESVKRFTIYIRKRYGTLVIPRYLFRTIKVRKDSKIAIIGVRSKPELDYIRKRGRSVTIAIVAPARLRYRRTMSRGRSDAPRTFAEFVKNRDAKEKRFGLEGAIRSADYIIAGTGTVAQLEKGIDQVLLKMKNAKAF